MIGVFLATAAVIAVAAVGDVVFDNGNDTLFAFAAIFNASSKFFPSSKCCAAATDTAEFDSAKRAVKSFTRSGRRMVDAACTFDDWLK